MVLSPLLWLLFHVVVAAVDDKVAAVGGVRSNLVAGFFYLKNL